MSYPVYDLHCDLLAYLVEVNNATAFDAVARCSIPQLVAGNVRTQVCAVFAETTHRNSSMLGQQQIDAFATLSHESLSFRLAIENLSALLNEEEPINLLPKRLDAIPAPAYISLTWNDANRFGGGNASSLGLHKDGAYALECMAERNIPLDLSHTSDLLAYEALDYIDTNRLRVPVMASHSNCRALCDVPRNLPDPLLKEVIARDGVIGLNGITHFLGKSAAMLTQHIEHILSLGGEHALACGADFFGGISVPTLAHLEPFFFPSFENATHYPARCAQIEATFGPSLTQKMTSENARRFLEKHSPHKERSCPV